MKTNENRNNELAVKYLGRTLMITIVGITIYGLATLGYNTYISATKEKIEVQAQNSNSLK